MSLKLTCPGCRDTVSAVESDRGKKIKCGTCWADVDVPPAEAPTAKAAPVPTAKAIPAGGATPVVAAAPIPPVGPKKATPLTTAAKPVTAVPLPVPAAPIRTATPVESMRARPADGDGPKKSRFKERDRRRDDDEEDDDRTAKKKGGGVMIAFICIATVLALGLVGGGVAIVLNNKPTASAATTPTSESQPTNAKPDPVPGTLPKPADPNPKPPPPVRPEGWNVAKGKIFECDMPGVPTRGPTSFEFAARMVNGDMLAAQDVGDAIKLTAIELKTGGGLPDSPAFVAAAFGVKESDLKKDLNPRLVSGYHGWKFTARTPDGYDNAFMVIPVGAKDAVLVRYQWKPGTAETEVKRDTFLASVNILVDPNSAEGRPPGDDIRVPKPINKTWVPLENKYGFEVKLPAGAKKERATVEVSRDSQVSGLRWSVNDGEVRYYAFVHDLAAGQTEADLPKIVSESLDALQIRDKVTQEDTKVGGRAATRWELKRHNHNSHGVSVKVGYRVFTLFVTAENFFSDKEATIADREDRFLNTLKITFDEKKDDTYPDDPAWVPMAKTIGFTALVPKQATSQEDFKPIFGFDAPTGKKWTTEADGIAYQAFVIDLTPPAKKTFPGPDKTVAEVLESFTKLEKLQSGPNKEKLGTLDAEGYLLNWDHNPSHMRVYTVGKVTFLLKTSRPKRWDKLCGDREFADKSEKFFANFRLGNVVAQPGSGGGGGEMPVGNPGDFAKLDAKVQPFWAAVFLPQAKEFMTFGVKDATAKPVRGVLRRYSLPDFKLKATYTLPAPVAWAVADEANGRLFVVSVHDSLVDFTKVSEKEAMRASGDVFQFDLAKLTDGSVGEGETVNSTATLVEAASALKVTGLAVSGDGSAVYVCGAVVTGKAPNLVFKGGRLLKWSTGTRKLATEIDTDGPLWALAAGGEKVVALERSLDATRGGGNFLVLDGPTWKRTRTMPLTGTPQDVAVAGDKVAGVLVPAVGQGALQVGLIEGDTVEVNTGGEVNYARFTPDGKRLLVAAGGQASGMTLYDVAAGKQTKLTKVATAAELGGMFVISSDGKLAVMNTGAVLDLQKSKAK